MLLFIQQGPNIDEGRAGSGGLDSSPSMHHNLHGAHASGNRSNNQSPATPSGQQMLVVPQPVKSSNSLSSATNGTGRKYQCKMCPQVSLLSNQFLFSFVICFFIKIVISFGLIELMSEIV